MTELAGQEKNDFHPGLTAELRITTQPAAAQVPKAARCSGPAPPAGTGQLAGARLLLPELGARFTMAPVCVSLSLRWWLCAPGCVAVTFSCATLKPACVCFGANILHTLCTWVTSGSECGHALGIEVSSSTKQRGHAFLGAELPGRGAGAGHGAVEDTTVLLPALPSAAPGRHRV